MRSLLQQCELEWLKKNSRGSVVELGPWLGSSTEALLIGNASTIDAFDKFIWESWMNFFEPNPPVAIGESFEQVFRGNIFNNPRVTVHSGDLSVGTPWQKDIDLLVIDAAKSVEAFMGIIRSFFPKMNGLIFDQDFRHAPCVHMYQKVIYMELKDYLKPVEVCGSAVIFEATPVPCGLIVDLVGQLWNQWTTDKISEALGYFENFL